MYLFDLRIANHILIKLISDAAEHCNINPTSPKKNAIPKQHIYWNIVHVKDQTFIISFRNILILPNVIKFLYFTQNTTAQ